jgi:outer membrane protein TolC
MQVRTIYQGIVLLLAGIFLAGCPSQEQIERDFQVRREAAYQRLMQTEPNDKATDLKIVTGGLTVADCIELALQNNKDVQTAKVKLLEAKGQMTDAIATALPQATFTGSALRNDNSGLFNQKETYELQVLARQPLYQGGVTGAAIDAAAVFAYMTQQELRAAIHRVELNIRSLYLNALLAEELVYVAEQSKRDAQELLKDTRTLKKFGTATRFDVLRSEVRLANVDAELIQIRNAYDVSLTRLLKEMGVSQLSEVRLSDALKYEKIETESSESLFVAMKQRPELLIGEAMIRLAKDNIKAERATNLPKVYLQGLYMRSYPGYSANFDFIGGGGGDQEDGNGDENGDAMPFDFDVGEKVWERTMSGGIVVEWPFFDGFRTDGRVVQAKAQWHRQMIGLKQLEEQVQLEVKQSLLNLASSDKFVQSQEGSVANAQEALRLSQVNFREGTATSLDVINAQTELTRARSNHAQAVRDYQLAGLSLDYATGVLGEESYLTAQQDARQAVKKLERMNP